MRYDKFSDYLDYCFGKVKIKNTFKPLETKQSHHRADDHRDKYPSAPLTKPTLAVDHSWKAEESKNFTVAPAYNKGAYQVIPRTDIQHIGK